MNNKKFKIVKNIKKLKNKVLDVSIFVFKNTKKWFREQNVLKISMILRRKNLQMQQIILNCEYYFFIFVFYSIIFIVGYIFMKYFTFKSILDRLFLFKCVSALLIFLISLFNF